MKSIDYKSREKITSAHSLVRVKDHVKVKVISLENNKITLSMNQVDQCTGDDLSKKQMMVPTPKPETLVANPRPGYGELTGIALDTGTKTGKEMNSPELWELNQMKNAKAFDYVYDPLMRLEVQNNLNCVFS